MFFAHPDTLKKTMRRLFFLPPNTTSLIQPMDQGIIHSLKCSYKTRFPKQLLKSRTLMDDAVDGFRKFFNIKDSIFMLARSGDSVSNDTLMHSFIIFFNQNPMMLNS